MMMPRNMEKEDAEGKVMDDEEEAAAAAALAASLLKPNYSLAFYAVKCQICFHYSRNVCVCV